jgi:guanylate kinase
MLSIFYGCSCVGKTSIMEALHHRYGWQFITIFTTRASRNQEFYKLTLDSGSFERKVQSGDALFVNECYGNFYGVSKDDILIATTRIREVWMLDFSIANHEQTKNLLNTKRVVILPEDELQLTAQISEANRSERGASILQDYRQNYADLHAGYEADLDSLCLVNHRNWLDESVEKVRRFVANLN